MNMIQAVKSVYSNYAAFSGRARRAEYWWFALFMAIVMTVLVLLDAALGTAGILGGLFGLVSLLPALGVTLRRLHDIDRSGWWYFIVLVPVVGPILLIVWTCTRGTTGNNRFGADPIATA